ncbi:MAG: hypothetical protein CM1200mP10_03010 [Candidatus Neomarinimicrobiota bacterium]|nr:MAG: hypothetical protein CM1200mP10_03010 [Candidatus Neomarinimicrobiota bacterium]
MPFFSTSFGTLTILASLLELTGRRKKGYEKIIRGTMNMVKIIFLLIIFFFYFLSARWNSYSKDVDERKAPQDIVSKTTMVLTNSKGKNRTSTILSKSINNGF